VRKYPVPQTAIMRFERPLNGRTSETENSFNSASQQGHKIPLVIQALDQRTITLVHSYSPHKCLLCVLDS